MREIVFLGEKAVDGAEQLGHAGTNPAGGAVADIEIPERDAPAHNGRVTLQFRVLAVRDVPGIAKNTGDIRVIQQIDADGFDPAVLTVIAADQAFDGQLATAIV